MEVPGDIKGDLCNMKTHLDQRNGTLHLTRPPSDPQSFCTFPLVWFKSTRSGLELEHELELVFAALLLCVLVPSPPLCRFKGLHHPTQAIPAKNSLFLNEDCKSAAENSHSVCVFLRLCVRHKQ